MSLAIIWTRFSDALNTYTRFDATGSEQTYTVPDDITQLKAYAFGAAGGSGIYSSGWSGPGGYAEGYITVTPGEVLLIRVGVGGGAPTEGVSGGLGGYPGGGDGSRGDTFGGGGVVYSGIFRHDGTPILIAGGGGEHGGFGAAKTAGAGGGTTGSSTTVGSTGGSQSAGGTSAGSGESGSYLQGGNANFGDRTSSTSRDSGGGGGGYYGGAPDDTDGGAGSGGSSYIGGVSSGVTYGGDDGTHTVSSSAPATINGETVSPRGNGVMSVAWGNPASAGNDGVIWIQVTG